MLPAWFERCPPGHRPPHRRPVGPRFSSSRKFVLSLPHPCPSGDISFLHSSRRMPTARTRRACRFEAAAAAQPTIESFGCRRASRRHQQRLLPRCTKAGSGWPRTVFRPLPAVRCLPFRRQCSGWHAPSLPWLHRVRLHSSQRAPGSAGPLQCVTATRCAQDCSRNRRCTGSPGLPGVVLPDNQPIPVWRAKCRRVPINAPDSFQPREPHDGAGCRRWRRRAVPDRPQRHAV